MATTGGRFECDVWVQCCQKGEKCMPYVNDEGKPWSDLRCAPLEPDPRAQYEPYSTPGDRGPRPHQVQTVARFAALAGAWGRRGRRAPNGSPWAMLALLELAACGPVVGGVGASETGGGSASSGTTDGSSVGATQTSAAGTSAGETGTTTTTSAGETGSLDGGETGWGGGSCDVWSQDCPEGQKCMPYANDGGNAWNATKCTPIAPDPKQPGEACSVEGNGTSGVDNCVQASMCWGVDEETNMGTCVPFCAGTPDAPMCDDPADTCVVANDGVLTLCLPRCDPLLQDCSADEVCIPVPSGDDFACVLDASEGTGTAGAPCESLNVCNPGLSCESAAVVPGCMGSGACCAPFCDLTDPNASQTCAAAYTEPGAECVPFFEMGTAPPEYEDVGVCLLPS